jgi:hypothetical protein
VFHFSQHLANLNGEIIIIIDYSDKIIDINVPNFKDSILLDHFSIFFKLQGVVLSNFEEFQNILRNLGYYFNPHDLVLIVLETFLSNRQVIVLFYSYNSITEHYHALQLKISEKEKINNNNNNNNNNNSNVKINISEYLGENNSSSIEIESNNNDDDDNSIIAYNDHISVYHANVSKKELDIDTLSLDFINFDKLISTNIPKLHKKDKSKFL